MYDPYIYYNTYNNIATHIIIHVITAPDVDHQPTSRCATMGYIYRTPLYIYVSHYCTLPVQNIRGVLKAGVACAQKSNVAPMLDLRWAEDEVAVGGTQHAI